MTRVRQRAKRMWKLTSLQTFVLVGHQKYLTANTFYVSLQKCYNFIRRWENMTVYLVYIYIHPDTHAQWRPLATTSHTSVCAAIYSEMMWAFSFALITRLLLAYLRLSL